VLFVPVGRHRFVMRFARDQSGQAARFPEPSEIPDRSCLYDKEGTAADRPDSCLREPRSTTGALYRATARRAAQRCRYPLLRPAQSVRRFGGAIWDSGDPRLPHVCRRPGLMSYGTDFDDAYRIVGTYAGKILSGTNTADLPVQGVPGADQPQSPPRARPHHPARHPCPRQRGDRVVSYATPTATRRKAMPAILTTSEEFEQWLTTPVEDAPKLQRAP
jgi:hypothetical protein